jgi:hypothetical protein
MCCQRLERVRGARLAKVLRHGGRPHDALGFQAIVLGAQDAQILLRARTASCHRADMIDLQRDGRRAPPAIRTDIRTPELGTDKSPVSHRRGHVAPPRHHGCLLGDRCPLFATLLSLRGIPARNELIQRDLEELFEGCIGALVPDERTGTFDLGHELLPGGELDAGMRLEDGFRFTAGRISTVTGDGKYMFVRFGRYGNRHHHRPNSIRRQCRAWFQLGDHPLDVAPRLATNSIDKCGAPIRSEKPTDQGYRARIHLPRLQQTVQLGKSRQAARGLDASHGSRFRHSELRRAIHEHRRVAQLQIKLPPLDFPQVNKKLERQSAVFGSDTLGAR